MNFFSTSEQLKNEICDYSLKLLNNIKLSDTPIFFTTLQGTELLANLSKYIHYLPKGGLQVNVIANSFSKTSSEGNKLTWESTKKVILETEQFPPRKADHTETS